MSIFANGIALNANYVASSKMLPPWPIWYLDGALLMALVGVITYEMNTSMLMVLHTRLVVFVNRGWDSDSCDTVLAVF